MSQQFEPLIAGLVADLRPVKPLKLRSGLAFALSALLACVLIVALAAGLRADIQAGQLDPVFLLSAGLFLLLAVASSFTVIEMSQPYVGGHRDGWMWAAATAALLPASAALIAVERCPAFC
jgi:hypothetical protein